jgi:hypothetical protein
MPVIDFSQVSDSFEPLPEGTYAAVLTEVEKKTAKSGNDYLSFTYSMVDDYEGRKAWGNYTLVPQSLWVLKQALVALGVPRNELGGQMTTEELVELCIAQVGNSCRVELEIREWNDRFSNSVKKVLSD